MTDLTIEWDEDLYPTESSLEELEGAFSEFSASNVRDIAAFIARLPDLMAPCHYASVNRRWIDDDGRKELEVEFHTRGWSGCEDVIHPVWNWQWMKLLFAYRWERGGHYWFRIPEGLLDNQSGKEE